MKPLWFALWVPFVLAAVNESCGVERAPSPALAPSAPGVSESPIPEGIDGSVVLLEKSADSADSVDRVQLAVGDKILIMWAYPPGSGPSSVKLTSDGASVQAQEVRKVIVPKVPGSGLLAASVVAVKEGKATVTFKIVAKTPSGADAGAVLKCEVIVAGK